MTHARENEAMMYRKMNAQTMTSNSTALQLQSLSTSIYALWSGLPIQSITEIHTVLAIFPLALDAAARVEVLPDGAKAKVACVESFAFDAAPRLAGAFLVGWLYAAALNNVDVRSLPNQQSENEWLLTSESPPGWFSLSVLGLVRLHRRHHLRYYQGLSPLPLRFPQPSSLFPSRVLFWPEPW